VSLFVRVVKKPPFTVARVVAAEWAYNYRKEKTMDYIEFKLWKAAVVLAIIFLAGIWKGLRGG
jgi:hypothetical protein